MKDDALYEEVAKELQEQKLIPGLWTRAFAESDGHIERTTAIYIKFRVAELKDALKQEKQRTEQEAEERMRREREDSWNAAKSQASLGIRRTMFGCFALLNAAFALVLGLATVVWLFSESSTRSVTVSAALLGCACVFGLIASHCFREARGKELT